MKTKTTKRANIRIILIFRHSICLYIVYCIKYTEINKRWILWINFDILPPVTFLYYKISLSFYALILGLLNVRWLNLVLQVQACYKYLNLKDHYVNVHRQWSFAHPDIIESISGFFSVCLLEDFKKTIFLQLNKLEFKIPCSWIS